MKNYAKIVLIGMSGLLMCRAQAGELTLQKARELTLENNPQIEEMAQRVAAAEAVLRQTRSAWFPQVSLSGSYMLTSVDMQPDFNPTIRVSDSFRQADGGIKASWLLFDGFAREARILMAKAGTNAADQVHRNLQRLMLQAVSIAFYQAQLAQEDMIIAQQDRDFYTDLQKDAERRWQIGSAPEADKLTFEVRALQAESAWLQADNNLDTAAVVLAQLMGLPGAELPDALMPERTVQTLSSLNAPDAELEIAYALQHRPDLKALRAQQVALQQQLREKRADWFPQIALTAGADYQHRDQMDPIQNNRNQFAGVVASWSLFTGGRRFAEAREIKAQQLALMAQIRQKELEIQADIRTSIKTSTMAYEVGARQEKAWKLSERIRDFVEKAYKAGAETQTRLNEAQTDLTHSAGQAASARIAYLMALTKLDSDTGRLGDD